MKLKIKKSNLIILPVAIIFAVGLILFIGAYAKKDAFSQFTLWGAKETTISSQTIDSDNDGLKDWEENLYKTDPWNPDTDGDGYLDGEEINSGHNPLVKGPNDNQVFYPLPVGDKYNITNKIFADFSSVLNSYIEQKNQYAQDHPNIKSPKEYLSQTSSETLTEMFTRAMSDNENNWTIQVNAILEQLPEIFNIEIIDNDIIITDDNSSKAINAYIQKLFSVIKSADFLLNETNLVLLKDSLISEDFAQIDGLILTNDETIALLLNYPVPSSIKNMHKQFLKLQITARNIFISLRSSAIDPIKALVAAKELENINNLWMPFINNLKNL
ncbi:MAG TPA: hypothetical protein PLF70_01125 [Candidatus Portnoybacteria bacterium]|mgnify:FL=1|jgi:hypothetical protein|nr:hypothetical protein [Candidatus Portnoybacteria bacterium]HPH52096.1 hypothetical protein [Candidatus Portnoybacteria bacterium]HPJ80291.1 hypothetical protein [Candidatus Portnoybacteria bacterium]